MEIGYYPHVEMSSKCDEDEEDGGPDEANFQERETEKQHLIYCQQRLPERGAAEMVLQVISGRVEITFTNRG